MKISKYSKKYIQVIFNTGKDKINSREKLVLLALANQVHKDGCVVYGTGLLSIYTGMTLEHTQHTLLSLAYKNYIEPLGYIYLSLEPLLSIKDEHSKEIEE